MINLQSSVSARLERSGNLERNLNICGKWHVEHYRGGELLDIYEFPNAITNVGMNSLLGIMFNAATQITTWYIGLVNASGFTGFNNADTMASHSGWTEFTNYSESNRVTWTTDAPSNRLITNSTTADFTITASGTLKGIFVTSNNTKGGTAGTLWSTGAFSADKAVANTDILKLVYSVSG
jgi:hypothetical protein